MMRKVLSVASFMVLTTAIPALAAELAVKPRVNAPAPVQLWTGCYIGGHVGGVLSEDKKAGQSGNSISYSSAGFVGGGQIGCDYEFAGGWVIGAEGRAAWSSLKNSNSGTVRNLATGIIIPSQFSLKNDFLASATARTGYSFADRWLVFVRGGAAWTRERADDAFTNIAGIAVDPSATRTRTGWTIGTGVDWAFAPDWSANIEYNYYNFGSSGALLVDAANRNTVSIYSLRDTIHAVTTGVNYHF